MGPNGQYKKVRDLPVTPNGQYKRGFTGRHAEQAESEDIVTKGTTLISIWVACTSSSEVELQCDGVVYAPYVHSIVNVNSPRSRQKVHVSLAVDLY